MSKNMLAELNEPQLKAVTADPCHMLVLAGAGSGKTRVLTSRIAWLIHERGFSPYSILAVTFTNKAAHEMRGRIESLLGLNLRAMWVGTFHSISHRLLRAHHKEAGLSEAFQIIDSDDQARVIKRLIKAMNLDESQWSPKQAQHFINQQKDKGFRASQVGKSNDFYTNTMQKIYESYEQLCAQSHLVDFSELLLRSYELFRDNDEVRAQYQQRFRYVLIDEFQDTNSIQYAWIKLLTETNNHLMIVGDDDQSIYGWRGANIDNIRQFSHDFTGAQVLRLEQNYRSTNLILKASNRLIANNGDRLGKELWSDGEEGEPIALYSAFNEIDEAKFVASRITQWTQMGGPRREVAILYRSNAQSRVIEESLIQAGIPYKVYGGLRFFERAEIKDALGYLRLIGNRDDDAAFERVVNQPTRGIGDRTLSQLRIYARGHQLSMWASAKAILANNDLTPRASSALQGFLELIEGLDEHAFDLSLDELTQEMLQTSGLLDHYRGQRHEKARAKVENLEELVTATKHFEPENEDDNPLQAFLTHAALESGEAQSSAYEDAVQMMTLHSAKGLEFPLVFMVGMEEGLFPHQLSIEEPGRLEEERRLCYVGMTRAMRTLYFTYAEIRRLHGKEEYHKPSRFIQEVSDDYVVEVRKPSKVYRPSLSRARTNNPSRPRISGAIAGGAHESGLKLGQTVRHGKFGDGVVLGFEGQGAQARVEVKFNQVGIKWLVLAYAKLETMS